MFTSSEFFIFARLYSYILMVHRSLLHPFLLTVDNLRNYTVPNMFVTEYIESIVRSLIHDHNFKISNPLTLVIYYLDLTRGSRPSAVSSTKNGTRR